MFGRKFLSAADLMVRWGIGERATIEQMQTRLWFAREVNFNTLTFASCIREPSFTDKCYRLKDIEEFERLIILHAHSEDIKKALTPQSPKEAT